MKVAALFSGGKDSVFAIFIAQQWGWDITHLVSLYPQQHDSWMFHSINIGLTTQLADAIKIPLIAKATTGNKEEELQDLETILKDLPIEGVISGAIASEYQRTRIERVCHTLSLKSFTPLWHKNPTMLLREQINAGFEIMITGVFAHGLDKTWLGTILDESILPSFLELQQKYQINPAGEGGEYETLVLNGPLFKKKLIVDEASVEWKRDNGVFRIQKARLVSQGT
jgi:diphthine-ammonia ligase